MLKKYVSIFFFIFVCIQSFSQKSTPLTFDHYGVKDGFTGKSSRGILRGSDGYMYITSEYGLAKYDGHAFQYFRSEVNDTTTFENNYLVKIAEDNFNTLWIITGNHVNTFDLKTQKVKRHYKTNGKIKTPYNVEAIYYDKSTKTTWIASEGGLYYNKSRKALIKKLDNFIPISKIMDIDGDGQGGLWMATNLGLIYLNTLNGKSKIHQFKTLKHTNKDESQLVSVHVGKDSIIWAGSWGYGFYKLNLNDGSESRYNFSSNGHQAVLKLYTSNYPDFKDYILLGTIEGLYIFEVKTGICKSYKSKFFEDIHGVSGAVSDFYEDQNNFIWICSYDGLHKLDFKKQFISNYQIKTIANYRSNDGPRGRAIEADSSTIWVYYSYGGIVRYNYLLKKEIPIPKVLEKYFAYDVDIFNIFIDSKNTLYIFTNQFGLIAFDLNRNKFLWEDNKYFFKSKTWVVDAAENEAEGIVYFATYNGLFQYDRVKNIMQEINIWNDATNDFCSKKLFAIKFGKDNKITLIHGDHVDYRCITSYDINSKKIISLTEKTNLAEIEDVALIGMDSFFLIGSQGACIATLRESKFSLSNNKNNQIAKIDNSGTCIIDNIGNVWGSEAFGVYYYDIKNNFFRNITTNNSSIGGLTRPNILYLEKYNHLMIFQKYGFDIIDGNNMDSNNKSTIKITEIEVSGTKFSIENMPKAFDFANNDITFKYSLFDFHNSNYHGYYTMLEGADKDWQYSVSSSKSYIKLAPGDYIFKVKGISSGGIPSNNIISIPFRIKPPFYNTWWFFLLCFGSITAILFALFRYREIQRQKLEAIRLQIARDLHDDLGSNLSNIKLMSELEVLKADKKDAMVYEDIAKQTINALGNMSDIVWAINPKNDDIPLIIEKIKLFCIEILEKQDIEIQFDISLPPSNIKLSLERRRHYYLAMKEIINNCSKYSKASKVVLKIYKEGNCLITQFEDNGCGFDMNGIKNGNGLNNIQDRIRFLKGSITITSSINMGTKHYLKIPIV